MPSDDASVLVLDFNILPPLTPEPVGTQPSREVLVGAFFSLRILPASARLPFRAFRTDDPSVVNRFQISGLRAVVDVI